jgi:hypothetical protein
MALFYTMFWKTEDAAATKEGVFGTTPNQPEPHHLSAQKLFTKFSWRGLGMNSLRDQTGFPDQKANQHVQRQTRHNKSSG